MYGCQTGTRNRALPRPAEPFDLEVENVTSILSPTSHLQQKIAAAVRRASGSPTSIRVDDPETGLVGYEEFDVAILATQFARDAMSVRSDGLHLGSILADLALALDIQPLKRKGDADAFTEEDLEGFAVVGFLWEWVFERAYAAASQQALAISALNLPRLGQSGELQRRGIIIPGEQLLDGIYMTPDGLNVEVRPRALEEYKATWISATADIRLRKPRWIWQMKAYCWVLGVNHANLRVLFVNGRYERGGRMGVPVARTYRFRFTDQDLEENWGMITGHREQMEKPEAALQSDAALED